MERVAAAVKSLREEARKDWEYVVSDKLVYVPQLGESGSTNRVSYIEHYVSGQIWIEAWLRIVGQGRVTDYIAVIEHAVEEELRVVAHLDMEPILVAECCDDPMFVNVAHLLMENPEQLALRQHGNVVRLKALDEVVGGTQIPTLSLPLPEKVARRLEEEDWKLNRLQFTFGETRVAQQRELVGELIEGRAEIEGKVSNDRSPFHRRRANFHANDVAR